MAYRKYRLGDYDEVVANRRWEVPHRYNIAVDVCDKHPRDRLAMVWESWRGEERKVTFGELQDLSNRFANVLEAHGVERGDRVATLLPSLPETAAVFLGTYKRGAILLSLSILYGDEGIEHRLSDSGAKVVVTDAANRHRIPDGLAEIVFVLDEDLGRELEKALTSYDVVDTAADDPAQLYYSSGTTGKAKGILHAHRYLLAHEEFEFCHDVREGALFDGSGEWAWAAGICPLLGPWRYGAVQFVYARKGGFDPEEQLHQLSKHGVQNMFTTPTALRAMTAVRDAGRRYPQQLRITCSAGEPLNPEVIRWFRDHLGGVPDRPLRGRVGVRGASGGPGGGRGRVARPEAGRHREGVHRAGGGPRAERCHRGRHQALRARTALGVRLPARGQVRRGPAEDPYGEDPTGGAAGGGARA